MYLTDVILVSELKMIIWFCACGQEHLWHDECVTGYLSRMCTGEGIVLYVGAGLCESGKGNETPRSLVRSHGGRNVGLGCLKIGCWGEYLGLRGTRYQVVGENYIMRSLMFCIANQKLCGWLNKKKIRWAGHVACMGESRVVCRVLMGKSEGKRPPGRPRHRWEDNIKMHLHEVRCWGHGLDRSDSGYGEVAGTCECGNEPSGSIKCGVFRD